jgi:hypothetical protein
MLRSVARFCDHYQKVFLRRGLVFYCLTHQRSAIMSS